MLDMPGGRRTHPRPIPRPGGLAIALAFGLTILAFWIIDRVAGSTPNLYLSVISIPCLGLLPPNL